MSKKEKEKKLKQKRHDKKVNRVLDAISYVSFTEYGQPVYTLDINKLAEVLANLTP